MRRVKEDRRACGCAAYHFPHRRGSGQCGNPYAPLVSLKDYRAMRAADTQRN
jgi:hypothetical protein